MQGDKIVYTVAVDDSGAAAQALMGAAGVSGIPHAFIIGEHGLGGYALPGMLTPLRKSREELAGMPVSCLVVFAVEACTQARARREFYTEAR